MIAIHNSAREGTRTPMAGDAATRSHNGRVFQFRHAGVLCYDWTENRTGDRSCNRSPIPAWLLEPCQATPIVVAAASLDPPFSRPWEGGVPRDRSRASAPVPFLLVCCLLQGHQLLEGFGYCGFVCEVGGAAMIYLYAIAGGTRQ